MCQKPHNNSTIDPFYCLPEHYRPQCPKCQPPEEPDTKDDHVFPIGFTSTDKQMQPPKTKCPDSFPASTRFQQFIMQLYVIVQTLHSSLLLLPRLQRIISEQIQSTTQIIPVPSSAVNLMGMILILIYIIITKYWDQR